MMGKNPKTYKLIPLIFLGLLSFIFENAYIHQVINRGKTHTEGPEF